MGTPLLDTLRGKTLHNCPVPFFAIKKTRVHYLEIDRDTAILSFEGIVRFYLIECNIWDLYSHKGTVSVNLVYVERKPISG